MFAVLFYIFCFYNALAATENFASRYITINNTSYHYISKGDPTKKMILFLHGFPEQSLLWKEQLKSLSAKYYAVAIDLKGFNKSGKPMNKSAYTYESMSSDIAAFARALGKKKFHLVGHDIGGSISWYFARTHREKLESLTIINAPYPDLFYDYYHRNPAQFAMSQYIRYAKRNRNIGLFLTANNYIELKRKVFYKDGEAEELVPKLFFDQMTQEAYLQGWKIPGAVESMLRYYHHSGLAEFPYVGVEWPLLRRHPRKGFVIDTPTMVLWGLKDKFFLYELNRGLEKLVKHLKVVKYPNHSHWIIHENPSEITKQIEIFLQTVVTANKQ